MIPTMTSDVGIPENESEVGCDADRSRILQELERITDSQRFRSSQRYPSFLRMIVEYTLEGRGEELKERTIGVSVFHRSPDYDTNASPTVRVAAAEVRKRLVSLYEESPSPFGIQIVLDPGSYVPRFVRSDNADPTPSTSDQQTVTPSSEASHRASITHTEIHPPSRSNQASFALWALLSVAVIAASAAGYVFLHKPAYHPSPSVGRFWEAFRRPGNRALLSIASTPYQRKRTEFDEPSPNMNLVDATRNFNIVPVADAVTLAKISRFLGEQHVPADILNAKNSTFSQIKQAPAVLIGGFNNEWTLRMSSQLPFYFEESESVSSIKEKSANNPRQWSISRTEPYSDFVKDYAIIARFTDVSVGHPIVITAGIGPSGTLAAGDFIMDEESCKKLFALAPKNWEGANVEAVIETDVIHGDAGPPKILATSFW